MRVSAFALPGFSILGFLSSDKSIAAAILTTSVASVGIGTYAYSGAKNVAPTAERPFVQFVSASNGHAVVATNEGRMNVQVGTVLSGLGTITYVGWVDGKWQVVGTKGRVIQD